MFFPLKCPTETADREMWLLLGSDDSPKAMEAAKILALEGGGYVWFHVTMGGSEMQSPPDTGYLYTKIL